MRPARTPVLRVHTSRPEAIRTAREFAKRAAWLLALWRTRLYIYASSPSGHSSIPYARANGIDWRTQEARDRYARMMARRIFRNPEKGARQ